MTALTGKVAVIIGATGDIGVDGAELVRTVAQHGELDMLVDNAGA